MINGHFLAIGMKIGVCRVHGGLGDEVAEPGEIKETYMKRRHGGQEGQRS